MPRKNTSKLGVATKFAKGGTSARVCSICHEPTIRTLPTIMVCPHCGSHDELVYVSKQHQVVCQKCECAGPKGKCKCSAIRAFAAHAIGREDYLTDLVAETEEALEQAKFSSELPATTSNIEELFNLDRGGFIQIVRDLFDKAGILQESDQRCSQYRVSIPES